MQDLAGNLNWQKSMMLYSNVYAGLILMAVICTIVITLVFKLKDVVFSIGRKELI